MRVLLFTRYTASEPISGILGLPILGPALQFRGGLFYSLVGS